MIFYLHCLPEKEKLLDNINIYFKHCCSLTWCCGNCLSKATTFSVVDVCNLLYWHLLDESFGWRGAGETLCHGANDWHKE